MKLKKRIAAIGAVLMIMNSISAIGASADQASYQDSNYIALAYTSFSTNTAYSNGTVTNLTNVRTSYSVKSSLYSKTSGGSVSSTSSPWNTATLSKNDVVKASASKSRNNSYTYSARTQIMRGNSPLQPIQSNYA